MTDKKCSNCKHWGKEVTDELLISKDNEKKWCLCCLLTDNDDADRYDAFSVNLSEELLADFVTSQDFYCFHFELKFNTNNRAFIFS